MGIEQRDATRPQFTDHCFTGDYPTALTDRTMRRTRHGNCRCWLKRADDLTRLNADTDGEQPVRRVVRTTK